MVSPNWISFDVRIVNRSHCLAPDGKLIGVWRDSPNHIPTPKSSGAHKLSWRGFSLEYGEVHSTLLPERVIHAGS